VSGADREATAVRAAAWTAAALSLHCAINTRLLRTPPPARTVAERVSVLLPARNEAARVAPSLRALLRSDHVPDLELMVLDDESGDGTADVVRLTAGDDPRVRLLGGRPVPPGWLGKPHACAQLAAAATGTVLVFVDADVLVRPDAIARTVTLLRDGGLDFVSPYPRQEAVTIAERLVQPLLQWSWLTFLPLRAAELSARPSLTAVNGQLLCVDAATYRRAGGHEAVRAAVLDDVALARALKRAGGRGTVADGTPLATTRMYRSWRELRDGYSKSLWAAGGTPGRSLAVAATLVVLYVLPPVAAAKGSRAGTLGYLGAVAGRMLSARRTGGRVWPDALAHPASVGVLAALTFRSVARARRGELSWRGRSVETRPVSRQPDARAAWPSTAARRARRE
jgi:hypothetical protein